MTEPTDTNQASELFELCKEVFEKTGWGDWSRPDGDSDQTKAYWKTLVGEDVPFISYEHSRWSDALWLAPSYTSDYLLEKLPREIRNQTIEVVSYGDHWEAAYSEARDALWDTAIKSHAADTPLKALLKLTIALSEAGELK